MTKVLLLGHQAELVLDCCLGAIHLYLAHAFLFLCSQDVGYFFLFFLL